MSGSESEDNIPDAQTCKKLCEEFAGITGTDTACAQFYLQDRDWDLIRSVNAFFDAKNSDTDFKVLTDGSQAEVVISPSGLLSALACSANNSSDPETPDKFKFITWNIDGLNQKSILTRTKAACDIINSEIPDVVCLQEIVPETYSYIEKHLPAYQCILGGEDNYFTCTLLRKNTVSLVTSATIPYLKTSMGRNMLACDINFVNRFQMCIINTHLESTAQHKDVRKEQLRQIFKYVQKKDEKVHTIVGGDLNLRDKELYDIGGLPDGVQDMWITCDQRKECEYTWDATRNVNIQLNTRFRPRFRFDRVYFRPGQPNNIQPHHFGLIGIEKLKSCGQFPSDHWGLRVLFSVSK